MPYHFLAFSRFGKEKVVSDEQWIKIINKVKEHVFPLLTKKAQELGLYKGCNCSPKIKDLVYAKDRTEVGVGLLKLPEVSTIPYKIKYRENINKINTYAFALMAKISDEIDSNVYSKLSSISLIIPEEL